MGMYDDVVCKYPLPLPADTKGYFPESFQTKDFDCALDLYEIREDGTLWLRECEREYIEGYPKGKTWSEKFGFVKETKVWWTQVNATKTISMYDYQHGNDEYDYWIEFSIVFVKGVVDKIDLVKFTATDNAERKDSNKKFAEEMKLRMEFKKTLRYKMFYGPYNKILRFVFKLVSKVNGYIYNNLWKWERKLSV